MSLAAKLRDALPAGTELNRDGMSDATGLTGKRLYNQLYAATARGELLEREKEGEKFYRLNPDYERKRGGRKAKADKPKKAAGARGRKDPRKYTRKIGKRPYRRLLKRMNGNQESASELHALALANYLAASALLRTTVGEQVERVEENMALATAVANHDRARSLYAAALAT